MPKESSPSSKWLWIAKSVERERNKMEEDLAASSSDESWELTEEENSGCNRVGRTLSGARARIVSKSVQRLESNLRPDHSWNPQCEASSSEGQSGLRRRPVQRELGRTSPTTVPARNRRGTAS